jgi:M6 family metalloprotease-like protein
MRTKNGTILFCVVVVVTALLLLTPNSAYAAPLEYVPVTVTQPDGVVLNLFASGDEFYNWLHDAHGYTIIQDPDSGYYVYADLVNGELAPTKFVVGRADPASAGLSPYLNISPEQKGEIRQAFLDQTRNQAGNIGNAPTTGTIANLVIFIRFSGESEFADATSTYTKMLNNSFAGVNSLYNYYREVSYDALTVASFLFPTPGSTIVSYQDSHTRGYFQPYNSTTNPSGYTGGNNGTERRLREHTLLRDAINDVNGLGQFPPGATIDGDGDGIVDSVTFIVSGSPTGWSSLLWPHKWTLSTYIVTINEKTVSEYAFQLQSTINTGVLAHEMFHVLGAPDLYHYRSNGIQPVGGWDVMEYDADPPQHMGCFMKFKYGDWISSIPELTSPGTYTLNPLTSSTNNCYKIASPNSTSEYFIIEYRRPTGSTFEGSLPGTGLLVYRINTIATGNASGPPDEVYIYRPGGTNSVNGSVNTANFSSNVGRTAINNGSNPSSFLSDGSAGGVNICNIGASNATISFDICSDFAILSPLQSNPAYAGPFNSPSKIVVEVTKPVNGLAKNEFSLWIGGIAANIVTLYEDSAKYVLEVMPPVKGANGLYDLTVSAVTSSGTVTDTEIAAVSYAAANNVDVVLLIDRTGSMAGSKIDAARNASKQFVDFMRINDMIGVVSFNTSATTNFPLTTISSSDTKTQAKAAIDAINAGGNTSIAVGLQRAQEQLTTLGQASHPWAIILLSDGQENTTPWVASVLPGIVSSKTVVYTIGLGSGADEALLMDIAVQTGGTYNFAPGPEQLAAIYNTIVGEVTNQQTLLSETGTAQAGVIDTKSVVVDSTISEATFSISWSNSATTISLQLRKPDGTIIDPSTASSDPNIDYSSGATFAYYRVRTPTLLPGVWQMQITGGSFSSPSVDKAGNVVAGKPYLAQVTATTILTIETHFDQSSYVFGEPVGIIVSLSDSHPILGANVTVSVQSPSTAAALIRDSEWIELNGDTIPDPEIAAAIKAASVQTTTSLTLYDDGAHGDGAPNDGVYANQFSGTTTAGTYTFNVAASGNTSTGDAFIRQDSKMINIGQGDSTFADVPTSYWAWDWIERLYTAGITAGCRTNPLVYCPENSVTRAQMAIFLERGMNGSAYNPPAATGMVFADVPRSYWAVKWIEKLYADGITTGCGTSPLVYCPESSVTRAQMAIFLLRAKYGAAYTPPNATGVFADVPLSYWAANWIEQLYVEGITGGCNLSPLSYCPENSVTRAEMAKFLVLTFSLP